MNLRAKFGYRKKWTRLLIEDEEKREVCTVSMGTLWKETLYSSDAEECLAHAAAIRKVADAIERHAKRRIKRRK